PLIVEIASAMEPVAASRVRRGLRVLPRETAVAVAALLVLAAAILLRRGPELLDDGAFFLRYAENALRGELWVWNPGEPPVWGASAPLWPLLLALPMALGMSGPAAAAWVGASLMLIAIAIVALALRSASGTMAAAAFVLLAALDSQLMYFATAGLETPLTVLLLAL